MISLRLELPPADLNLFRGDVSKSENSGAALPNSREQNLAPPPTILEDSPLLVPDARHVPVEDSKGSFSECGGAAFSTKQPREVLTQMLQGTVANDDAFPADRIRAAQYLEEAGETPQFRLPGTPR